MDGFELAWRAVLGQQVSVRGASTLAGRFAERFGKAIATPHAKLNQVGPTAQRVSRASVQQVAEIGLPKARAASLIALAKLCHKQPGLLRPGTNPDEARSKLLALPGIGPWTAEYILMRGLRWPDAFPANDLGLRHALERQGAPFNKATSAPWHPWRSYAALHLWTSLAS
jgi:AraC family transcriptional regulator of adaptative response / DNA-3-methyladenine glycosylase II